MNLVLPGGVTWPLRFSGSMGFQPSGVDALNAFQIDTDPTGPPNAGVQLIAGDTSRGDGNTATLALAALDGDFTDCTLWIDTGTGSVIGGNYGNLMLTTGAATIEWNAGGNVGEIDLFGGGARVTHGDFAVGGSSQVLHVINDQTANAGIRIAGGSLPASKPTISTFGAAPADLIVQATNDVAVTAAETVFVQPSGGGPSAGGLTMYGPGGGGLAHQVYLSAAAQLVLNTNANIDIAAQTGIGISTVGGGIALQTDGAGFGIAFNTTGVTGGGSTVQTFWVAGGPPAAGEGNDGDFAFRQDGGGGNPTIYQRRAGAWVAVV